MIPNSQELEFRSNAVMLAGRNHSISTSRHAKKGRRWCVRRLRRQDGTAPATTQSVPFPTEARDRRASTDVLMPFAVHNTSLRFSVDTLFLAGPRYYIFGF
jgi:hypothetical protein